MNHTCNNVDRVSFHCSSGVDGQVFNIDKQTLPLLYKFGLKRIVPLPVVLKSTNGGDLGKSFGKYISNSKAPFSYGVSCGPKINAYNKKKLWKCQCFNSFQI